MKLTISARRIAVALILLVLFFGVVNLVGQLYKYLPTDGLVYNTLPNLDPGGDGAIALFDVDFEGSIPTWYSSSTILLCSILFAVIAAATRGRGGTYVFRWWGLSAVFLLLSADEAVQFHEKVSEIVENTFGFGGFFTYGWVVPAGIFLIIFVLAYLKFFIDLPPKTRLLFLVAGVLYVGGAVGLEMVAGRYEDLYGSADPALDPLAALLVGAEEFLEMTGIVVLIYALLSYLGTYFKDLHVLVKDG